MTTITDPTLLMCEPGTRLAQDRYEVLLPIYSTINFPYPVKFSAFVVLDNKDSKCKCLQAFSKDTSEAIPEAPQAIEQRLDARARSVVLLSSDSFTHEGHLCCIQVLRGPILYTLRDSQASLSVSWVRKVFRETLEALQALHTCGLVVANLSEFSFLFTYPSLADASREEVEEFYRPKDEEWHVYDWTSFNEFGSGSDLAPDTLDFKVKLQNLRTVNDNGKLALNRADPYRSAVCPAPEALLEGSITEKADIWRLGIMMADFVAEAPFFITTIGGGGTDPKHKIFDAQQYLGPLPPRFSSLLSSISKDVPKQESLLKHMQENRKHSEGLAPDLAAEKSMDRFSLQSLEKAEDLLKGMLKYDPAERLSASEALKHPFFQ